jgi:hypothetical protein
VIPPLGVDVLLGYRLLSYLMITLRNRMHIKELMVETISKPGFRFLTEERIVMAIPFPEVVNQRNFVKSTESSWKSYIK